MNNNTLGEIFQEICDEFSKMEATTLDELEDRVLNAMRRVGSYLMEKKMEDWNIQLYHEKQETCERCGSKLKYKQEERQIATWVNDITIKRYKRYCPECKETEYPLDKALGIQPRQRYSNSVEELSVLCGASWDYEKSEYIMGKVLRRSCVSHETVFNKTNEVGEAAGKELEGTKIKELEGDKKAQVDYFEEMELSEAKEQSSLPIYVDMDGVMINSRDNDRRMEGKVALVWSNRQLVKSDTYALTDKRYMGSFTDTERLYWEVTSEIYKRSGGDMDESFTIIRGDGAVFIRSFRSEYAPRSKYLLDHHHLCEKLKERLGALYEDKNRLAEVINKTLVYLNLGEVDSALSYISKLMVKFRSKRKLYHLKKLIGYIERNREGIWYNEAIEKGISIGSGSADKAGDILICRRMKLRGMRWSRKKADNVLNIRILILNGEWDRFWKKYKAA